MNPVKASLLPPRQSGPQRTKDLRMISRSVRERWNVKPHIKTYIIERLHAIVKKEGVSAPNMKGEIEMREDVADAHAIMAARVLAQIDQIDQADHQHEDKVSRLDAGMPTEVFSGVTVKVPNLSLAPFNQPEADEH